MRTVPYAASDACAVPMSLLALVDFAWTIKDTLVHSASV